MWTISSEQSERQPDGEDGSEQLLRDAGEHSCLGNSRFDREHIVHEVQLFVEPVEINAKRICKRFPGQFPCNLLKLLKLLQSAG